MKVDNRHISCVLKDIEFQSQKMHIYLFNDITTVHREEKLRLETKFKNIFLSSMSHNLKTPINSKNTLIYYSLKAWLLTMKF